MFIFFSENKSNQTITQFSSWVIKKTKEKKKKKRTINTHFRNKEIKIHWGYTVMLHNNSGKL